MKQVSFLTCTIHLIIFMVLNILTLTLSDQDCAKHLEHCDTLFSRPCCSEEHYCRSIGRGAHHRELRCIRPAMLDEPCVSSFDCYQINFAECSETKKCRCINSFIATDNSACLSPLNGFCMIHDDCSGNLSCIDSQCKCGVSFELIADNQCKQYAFKSFCQSDKDCDDVRHARCSGTNECVCRPNNILVNSTTCLPMIDAFCWEAERCAIDNSACIDSTCQCRPGFKYFSKRDVCLKDYIGMRCKNHQDCKSLKNTKCSSFRKCLCMSTTTKVNATTCLSRLNYECNDDNDCAEPNSVCFVRTCKCKLSYMSIDNEKCELITLGRKCKGDSDCQNPFSERCSADEICICRSHHVAVNGSVCKSFMNGICFSQEDCAITNSICSFGYCQCESGFVPFSQNLCLPEDVLYSCVADEGCKSLGNKLCSKSRKCTCRNRSFTKNPSTNFECMPLIGGFCDYSSECGINNSICFDNKCQCDLFSTYVADNLCILKSLL